MNSSDLSPVDLMNRGWTHRRNGRMAEAERDLAEAVALLRQDGNHADLVTALGRLGHIAMDERRLNEAYQLFQERVELCRTTGDDFGLAHSIRHLGDVHRHSGRDQDAFACYEESLALYQRNDDPPTLDYANAMRMVAIGSEDLGQIDRAARLWSEMKDLYAAIALQEGVDECADHLEKLRGAN